MNDYIQIDTMYLRADGYLKNNAPADIKLEYFINRANKKHNFKFNYNNAVWDGINTPISIICPIHGQFTQKPSDHVQSSNGCQQCGKTVINNPHNRYTLEQFIKKSNKLHNNAYTYELVEYKRITDEVTITCPSHGPFTTIARNHYQGRGHCPHCHKRESGFYSHGYFNNHPEAKLLLGKLYFVRMYNDSESFYKIGITKYSAYHRFYVDEKIKYNVEIIKEVEMPLYEAYKQEQHLLQKYSLHYATPLIDFGGKTECLTIDIRSEL